MFADKIKMKIIFVKLKRVFILIENIFVFIILLFNSVVKRDNLLKVVYLIIYYR